MRGLVRILGLVAALLAAGSFALAQPIPVPTPRPAHAPQAKQSSAAKPLDQKRVGEGRVFLLRGLANVFSLGMDRLAAKLHAKGVPVRVTNHSHWKLFATLLVTEYKSNKNIVPIIIIGHSLGADAAVAMGDYLASRGVPVRLVVAFDGVTGAMPVVNGVAELINYYKPKGYGRLIKAAPGYKGELINVDLTDKPEIDHLNIDKSVTLHNEVIAKVTAIFAGEQVKKKPVAKPKPAVAAAPAGTAPATAEGAPAAGTVPADATVPPKAATAVPTGTPPPAATATTTAPATDKEGVVSEPLPPPATAEPAATEPMPTTAPPPPAASEPKPDPARFVDG